MLEALKSVEVLFRDSKRELKKGLRYSRLGERRTKEGDFKVMVLVKWRGLGFDPTVVNIFLELSV